jgi:hypothetical protein
MKATLREVNIPGGHGTLTIVKEDESVYIIRIANRGKVVNNLGHYEDIQADGTSVPKQIGRAHV